MASEQEERQRVARLVAQEGQAPDQFEGELREFAATFVAKLRPAELPPGISFHGHLIARSPVYQWLYDQTGIPWDEVRELVNSHVERWQAQWVASLSDR